MAFAFSESMSHDPDKHHRRSIRLLYGHGAPCPNHCLPARIS